MDSLLIQYITEQPIIRSHEKPVARVNSHCPAHTANAGINDADEDRSEREIAITGSQHPRTRKNILRPNFMRNINQLSIGSNAERHTLHHSDVAVSKPKVG